MFLKKQVTYLKNQNATLKQDMLKYRTNIESIRENLKIVTDEMNARVVELTDSLNAKSTEIKLIADHQYTDRKSASLNHTLLFLILIAAIMAIAWIFRYLTGKIKAGSLELENSIRGRKEETEADMSKIRNDFQSQLVLLKEGFDQKTREMEKHLNEMEIKH